MLSWYDAEKFFVSQRGQLASIRSQDDNDKVAKEVGHGFSWLGGRKVQSKWQWSDNSAWDFLNCCKRIGKRTCMGMSVYDECVGSWEEGEAPGILQDLHERTLAKGWSKYRGMTSWRSRLFCYE